MDTILASVLSHAVAVALSPMPIAALILILLSHRAKLNSILFLIGWMGGLFLNVFIIAILFDTQPTATGQRSSVAMIINLLLGLFLLFLAFKQWKSRPKHGEEAKTPGWLAQLENLSPFKTVIIALSLVTINAKNTVVDIAAGVTIGHLSDSLFQTFTTVLIYSVVGSLTILLPVMAFLIVGKKMNGILQTTKVWFIQNSATILFVLFLMLGVELISKAFGG